MALQKTARRPGRPGCIGVKCHRLDEPNVLNHKRNPRATPHGADYLHNSPRHMHTVILHSDSKGQRFESTRAHQSIEIEHDLSQCR